MFMQDRLNFSPEQSHSLLFTNGASTAHSLDLDNRIVCAKATLVRDL